MQEKLVKMSRFEKVQLVDCPRDAIQGINHFIPTAKKIAYINQLAASQLFDYIDFGSFVSPQAVPQLKDTEEVLAGIDKKSSKLIAIVANSKGIERALPYQQIDYLGYPFSISETFQLRNTKMKQDAAFQVIETAREHMAQAGKQELLVYLSMGFGNPYGDVWHPELVMDWMERLVQAGIRTFSIADTTAEATPEQVKALFSLIRSSFPELELRIHLHSRIESALLKIEAAYAGGCRIFEGALMGYGGCPFAQDDLVGNIPSELLLHEFKEPDNVVIADLLQGFQNLIKS